MARFGSLGTQYFDDSGDPISGGSITFYEIGTTTEATTYSDEALTTANANPVVLDSAGRQPNIFFSGQLKAVLKDSAGTIVQTRDPVGTPWGVATVGNTPSGTEPVIDPVNGVLQSWSVSADSSPTLSLVSGEFVFLLVTGADSHTITWGSILWDGGAEPVFGSSTGTDLVILFNVNGTNFGWHVGNFNLDLGV